MNGEKDRKHPLWTYLQSGLPVIRAFLWLSVVGFFGTVFLPCISLAQDTVSDDDGQNQRCLIVVQGVAGAENYQTVFSDSASQWVSAAEQAGMATALIAGAQEEVSCRDQLETQISEWCNVQELWIVLIGHGTFDGESAKFNLVGEDVSAKQIAEWLVNRKQQTILINGASCSGPFVNALTGPQRVVVTATKSGYETSFAHFGRFLAQTLNEKNIDLDKDGRTSLLESVIAANGKTEEFYQADSRLPTEHALIDDNGDALGTPVEWYRGVRISRKAKESTQVDGLRANQVFLNPPGPNEGLSVEQRQERDELESELEVLINRKSEFAEDRYYLQMEKLMLRLAQLYRTDQTGESKADSGQ